MIKEGVRIKVYDPKAMERTKKIFANITYCKDAYEVCDGSDALVILTEWDEFKNLDIKKVKDILKTPIIVDGRNIFDPETLKEIGFVYTGVGRK